MADERYEWLDAEVAERLLRGEPVEPVGDQDRTDALRLEAALREARTVPPAGGELPGEAAVLAAFRDVSRAGGRSALRTRWTGTAHTSPPRRARWSRPLRYGLVVSLAGCALGGVAVAAGTGMLPGPFGGQESPVPAASVSTAAESPSELGSGPAPDAGPPVYPPGSPGTSESAAPSGSPEAPETGTGTGGNGPSGHAGVPDPRSGAPDGDGEPDGGEEGTDGNRLPDGDGLPDGSVGGSAESQDRPVQACRDHRDGTLDRKSRRSLVLLARGEGNLDRFCDRILDEAGGNGGAEGDGSGSGDEGDGSESGGGTGQGEGGEEALPSVSFDRSAPSPAASDDTYWTDGDDAEGDDADGDETTVTAPPRPAVTTP